MKVVDCGGSILESSLIWVYQLVLLKNLYQLVMNRALD